MLIPSNSLKSPRKHSLRLHSRGVSLVEILITVLVSSVGLLGIAALHLASLRNNFESTIRTQASTLTSDIVDRMRTNRKAALEANAYTIAAGATYASPATRPERDIAEWKTALALLLPSGDGSVAVNSTTRLATITITWSERGSATPVTFTTMTEL